MGLAGIGHGIGEILQGSVAPPSLIFPSWPDSPFFHHVAGEPAMTLLPNLLVTGLLTVLFSLAFLVWAIFFVQRKHGGLVLMLLAVPMLLLGGGLFPPVLGALMGILGTAIDAPLSWWRTHVPVGLWHALGKLWRGSFIVCVIAWLLLSPGLNLLVYFFGVDDVTLTSAIVSLALGSLLLTGLSGFALDLDRKANSVG
jgi:hypothetical protein